MISGTSHRLLTHIVVIALCVALVSHGQALPPYPYPPPPSYPVNTIAVPAGAQLGMVIATHRHGVRTPVPSTGGAQCTDIGCGELTYNGKVMLANLGQYFAIHYGVGGSGFDSPAPLNNGNGVIPANAAEREPTSALQGSAISSLSANISINRYDARSARVIATSYDRAIQSGVGVVNGLYASVNAQNGCGDFGEASEGMPATCSTPADLVYPLIDTDPNNALLYATNSNPSFLAFQQAYNATMYPFMGNLTLRLFSSSTLLTMSIELSMTSGECDDNSTGTKAQGAQVFDPYSCGLDLQDEMRYLYATFGSAWLAAKAPTVSANIARLDATLNLFSYYYLYGYDSNEVANQTDTSGLVPILPLNTAAGVEGLSVSQAAGYLCYPMALSIIADMKTTQPVNASTGQLINPQQAQDQGVLRFKDYSAHDMTLMELANAMGNYSNAAFDAPFAVTMYFEVWVTNAGGPSEDPTTRHIRALYGYPEQDANSNHSFSFAPYTMVCMSSTQVIYAAPNGCPLADWEQYMATRGPMSPAGMCYISDETRALLDCGPEVVLSPSDAIVNAQYPTTAELNRQMCYNYRQMCPQWSCARNSGSDYELIASAASNVPTNTENIPYALDQLSNNCVRRFTSADANSLSDERNKVTFLSSGIYIMASLLGASLICVVVLFVRLVSIQKRFRLDSERLLMGEEGEGKVNANRE